MTARDEPGAALARRLILVKHAAPAIVPAVPAADWRLSAAGRRDCARLAAHLAAWRPARLVASREPKAAETAELVARRLGLPWETAAGLHEHDRRAVGFLDPAAWQAAMAAFFAEPDRLVFGAETAAQAGARFAAAVEAVLARHPAGDLAVVAHGTVIALYVAQRAGLPAHAFWQRLGLPGFVVLALPAGAIVEVVATV
jgi:broad specificity phosphatase PhoE